MGANYRQLRIASKMIKTFAFSITAHALPMIPGIYFVLPFGLLAVVRFACFIESYDRFSMIAINEICSSNVKIHLNSTSLFIYVVHGRS